MSQSVCVCVQFFQGADQPLTIPRNSSVDSDEESGISEYGFMFVSGLVTYGILFGSSVCVCVCVCVCACVRVFVCV